MLAVCTILHNSEGMVQYFRSERTKSDLSFGGVGLPFVCDGGEDQRPNYFLPQIIP